MYLNVIYFHLFLCLHYLKISYPIHPLYSVFISSCCSSLLFNFDLVIFVYPILSISILYPCMTYIVIAMLSLVDNAHSNFHTHFAIRCLFCVNFIHVLPLSFTNLLCWLLIFCLLAQVRCFCPVSIGIVGFVGFKVTNGQITAQVGDYR